MVKNQHLLAALVVLGVVNLLAFFGLMSGERASARELAAAREEQKRAADAAAKETSALHQRLEEARAAIVQLHGELEQVRSQLAKTRRALETVEEKLKTEK
jgi:uncharacterized membrane protein